jgi:hypothetical protein
MAKVEKTNEIEKPEEPAEQVGEQVALTNPIEVAEPVVYYSDVPGAGPEDAPAEDAPAPGKAAAAAKQVDAPANTKAQAGPANKK